MKRALIAAALAVPIGLGAGWMALHDDEPKAKPDVCVAVRTTADGYLVDARSTDAGFIGDSSNQRREQANLNLSNLIVQNPSCFTADERAQAQTFLDRYRRG